MKQFNDIPLFLPVTVRCKITVLVCRTLS